MYFEPIVTNLDDFYGGINMKTMLFAGALVILAGCVKSENAQLIIDGPGIDLSPTETSAYIDNQSLVLAEMVKMTSITLCSETVTASCTQESSLNLQNWNQITMAGLFLVDRACERYVNALFWFDRAKDRTGNQVGLFGTTTAAVLGLTGASSKAIALTAVAFGLTTATIENVGSGLLYELEPAAIRELIEKLQIKYLDTIRIDQIDGRVSAFWALQNYASLCLPAVIETEIVKAVRKAAPESAQPQLAGVPPTVGQDVKTIVVAPITDAQDNANIAKLRNLRATAAGQATFMSELKKTFPNANNVDGMLVLTHPDFAQTRAEMVSALNL